MPKRSEILHFRATPEERAELERRAHPYDLSRLIRQALGLPVGLKATVSPESLAPTQPAVEESDPPLANPGSSFICCGNPKGGDHEPWCDVGRWDPLGSVAKALGETYEQFMERRVEELTGEHPSPGDDAAARANAYAEWRLAAIARENA